MSIPSWILLFLLILQSHSASPPKYLVNDKHCQILDTKSEDSPVTKLFKKLPLTSCSSSLPLSTIVYNKDPTAAALKIFPHRFAYFNLPINAQCLFQNLSLSKDGILTARFPPKFIQNDKLLPLNPSITTLNVSCKSPSTNSYSYTNVHHIILRSRPIVQAKINYGRRTNPNKEPKMGILMLQLDSTSMSSISRQMPRVVSYLHRMGWFPFMGHHKVGLNTYPNLNAIFAGQFAETYEDEKRVWRDFHRNGYITFYAEDVARETLAYYENRTDFETRTLKTALCELPFRYYINYPMCNGAYSVFDRLYEEMIQFGRRFRGERYLGLFVSSALTHDDVNGGSLLRLSMEKYLKLLDRMNLRNDSMIVFYGDHGLRFGGARDTFEGAREDSMPMLWISLPEWFQRQNPKIVQAMRVNRNRLTSHLDLHVTLKHFIELNGGGVPLYRRMNKCRGCASLFEELPNDRNCSDAGILPNHCFCGKKEERSEEKKKKKKNVKESLEKAEVLVQYMNEYNAKYEGCVRIRKPKVLFEREVEGVTTIMFNTNLDGRVFEGSVKWQKGEMVVVGDILDVMPMSTGGDCAGRSSRFCQCVAKGKASALSTTKNQAMGQLQLLHWNILGVVVVLVLRGWWLQ